MDQYLNRVFLNIPHNGNQTLFKLDQEMMHTHSHQIAQSGPTVGY